MNVLITGYRNFNDYSYFSKIMDSILSIQSGSITLIHGGATGADALAQRYGKERGITTISVPADWSKGRSAGPIRNQKMIDIYKPSLVIGFISPDSKGTLDCLERCSKSQSIKVIYRVYI